MSPGLYFLERKKKKAGFYNPKPFSNWLKPFWGIKMGLKKKLPKAFLAFHTQAIPEVKAIHGETFIKGLAAQHTDAGGEALT